MRTNTILPIAFSLIASFSRVSARPVADGLDLSGDWRTAPGADAFNSTIQPRGGHRRLGKRGGAYDAEIEAVVVGAPASVVSANNLVIGVTSGSSVLQLATSSVPSAVSTSRAAAAATSAPIAQAAQVTQSPSSVATTTSTTTSKATTTTTTTTSTTTTTTTTTSAAAASFTGKATFFYQDSAGACGNWNGDSVKLVALDSRLYGDMDAVSQYCGKSLTITNTANGKSVVAIVADACPGCSSKYSLDLSTGAFDAIGDEDTGILPISWYWN